VKKRALLTLAAASEDSLERFGADLTRVCEPRTKRLLGDANDAKALERGIILMTRFHQNLSKEVSNRVFISYSHKDQSWLERVKEQFAGSFPISSTWYDARIEPGEQWEKEIDTVLNASKVAILLLSPNFFESHYITEHEVPAIIAASEQRRIKPIPIFISGDDTRWEASPLRKFQAANKGRPLDNLSEDERKGVLESVVNQIKREIQVA
jgi:TIR domain